MCLQPVYLTSLVPYDTAEEGETGGAQEEGGEEMERGKHDPPPLRRHTYKEAVKKFYLHYTDNNMVGRLT